MDTSCVSNDGLCTAMIVMDETDDDDMESVIIFVNELKVAQFICPAEKNGDEYNIIGLSDDEQDVLALFTDFNEFASHEDLAKLDTVVIDFKEVQNILEHEKEFTGIIINPLNQSLLLNRDFVSDVELPEEEAYTEDPLSISELKEYIYKENPELEELLSDFENTKTEELFDMLMNNYVLTVVSSDEEPVDGLLVSDEFYHVLYGQLCPIYSKLDNIDLADNEYVQITTLSDLALYVLKNDLHGFILNPGIHDIEIPRFLFSLMYDFLYKMINPKFRTGKSYAFDV